MPERLTSYENDLQKRIHRNVSAKLIQGGVIEVHIPCEECSDPPTWTTNKMLAADAVAGKLRKIGWTIGRHCKCPNHKRVKKAVSRPANDQAEHGTDTSRAAAPIMAGVAHKPKLSIVPNSPIAPIQKKEANAMTKTQTQTQEAPQPALETPVSPSPASVEARAAKRQVISWLDEGFDVEAGRFKEDVNDASIAKETGLSEAQVKALREDLYGPLKEPKEIADLRDDITRLAGQQEASNRAIQAALEKLARDTETSLTGFATTAVALNKQQEESNKKFAESLEGLNGRLIRVCSLNNWPS